jgi:riboflavin synthase
MFTGIIETLAQVVDIQHNHSNIDFIFSSTISHELKIDQSVAHNGVCLTVVALDNQQHKVTAIQETLQKTNLGKLKIGDKVNLERCLQANGRFDGHFVQGHVDQVAICTEVKDNGGSWSYSFEYDYELNKHITVSKGSITVNGTSLTVVNAEKGRFSVAIIPYTYEHTNFQYIQQGDTVNIEFDIFGKYINAYLQQVGMIKN